MLTTSALLVLGGIASLLASLYAASGGALGQTGDVVLAVGTAAGLVLSRTTRRP